MVGPPSANLPQAFTDGPTPSVAAILFEIREQHQIGTTYKFRYSQTDDTIERATCVKKWKDIQESKYYLKAACRAVWVRDEEKRRAEEQRKREEEERKRLEQERREREKKEEERKKDLLRIKKEFHDQEAPWWVRAAMVQIPPALPRQEPLEVAMEEASAIAYEDYNETFSREYENDLVMSSPAMGGNHNHQQRDHLYCEGGLGFGSFQPRHSHDDGCSNHYHHQHQHHFYQPQQHLQQQQLQQQQHHHQQQQHHHHQQQYQHQHLPRLDDSEGYDSFGFDHFEQYDHFDYDDYDTTAIDNPPSNLNNSNSNNYSYSFGYPDYTQHHQQFPSTNSLMSTAPTIPTTTTPTTKPSPVISSPHGWCKTGAELCLV